MQALSPRTLKTPLRPAGITGFTLIELLVVVAVIAVLAALVLSSLGSLMRHAKTTACLSNLRECGVLVRMYGADHDGYFPATSTNSGNNGYVKALAAYVPTNQAASSKNVFVSPAAVYPTTPYGGQEFTYAVHNGLFGGTGHDPLKMTAVMRPSEVIMMANGAQIASQGYSCTFTFYNPGSLNQGQAPVAASLLDQPIPVSSANNVDNANGQGYLRYVQNNNTAVNAVMVDGHAVTIPMGQVLYRNVIYAQ